MYPNPFDRKHSTFKQVIDRFLFIDQNNIYRRQKSNNNEIGNNNSELFANKNTKNNSKLWKGFSKKNHDAAIIIK